MATASSPPNINTSNNKTTLSVALALALIALIVFLGCVMNRIRPHDISARVWHPPLSDNQKQKGIEVSILDLIPTVIYHAELRPYRNKEAIDAHNSADALEEGTLPKLLYRPVLSAVKRNDGDIPFYNLGGKGEDRSSKEDPELYHNPARCSICTEDFNNGEKVRILPCSHIYHRYCIDTWLLGFSESCPLCRTTLNDPVMTTPLERPRRALLRSVIMGRTFHHVRI